MASTARPLETIFADIRDAGTRSRRQTLRRHAATYRRDPGALLTWTFPASRAVVTRAIAEPDSQAASRALCRALWRDLQAAKSLPRYLAGRPLHISALRLLFACECARYRRRPAAPVLTTGEWLTGLCRAVETGAVARTARAERPRTVLRPPAPEPATAAGRGAAAPRCQFAGSNPGPSSGHRK